MGCFTLAWLQQFLVWCIIVGAVISSRYSVNCSGGEYHTLGGSSDLRDLHNLCAVELFVRNGRALTITSASQVIYAVVN